jgi:hypothetical protein
LGIASTFVLMRVGASQTLAAFFQPTKNVLAILLTPVFGQLGYSSWMLSTPGSRFFVMDGTIPLVVFSMPT